MATSNIHSHQKKNLGRHVNNTFSTTSKKEILNKNPPKHNKLSSGMVEPTIVRYHINEVNMDNQHNTIQIPLRYVKTY
jgi:hypothetical protein